MTETTTQAYDPIPGLAWLLGSAQRLALGIDSTPGVVTFARRLIEGLGLPYMATADEAEAAIRKALPPAQDDGPNPLDARLLTMARLLREALYDDAAGEIEVNAAFVREAWRGSDDTGAAEGLETIAAYAKELARTVREWPGYAHEADVITLAGLDSSSEEGQADA